MKTPHAALVLRGNQVKKGIATNNGQVSFTREARYGPELLASSVCDGDLDKVYVAITKNGVVLAPCEGTPQKELVLVQQYSPGSGAKRWPSFYVKLGPEVRQLSTASSCGGSGSENWVLVSAPLGWVENIARQFINERDYGQQTISYKPGNAGKKESDLPQDLLIAFRGNEKLIHQFMTKAAALPFEELDDHIIQNCGRARVQAHLEKISGDPDFFLGADPNRISRWLCRSKKTFESGGGWKQILSAL